MISNSLYIGPFLHLINRFPKLQFVNEKVGFKQIIPIKSIFKLLQVQLLLQKFTDRVNSVALIINHEL